MVSAHTMSSNTSSSPHVLVVTFLAFGHARPEIAFALRLLKLHANLRFTILIPKPIASLAADIIQAFNFKDEEQSRLRTSYYVADPANLAKAFASQEDDGSYVSRSRWLSMELEEPVTRVVKVVPIQYGSIDTHYI